VARSVCGPGRSTNWARRPLDLLQPRVAPGVVLARHASCTAGPAACRSLLRSGLGIERSAAAGKPAGIGPQRASKAQEPRYAHVEGEGWGPAGAALRVSEGWAHLSPTPQSISADRANVKEVRLLRWGAGIGGIVASARAGGLAEAVGRAVLQSNKQVPDLKGKFQKIGGR